MTPDGKMLRLSDVESALSGLPSEILRGDALQAHCRVATLAQSVTEHAVELSMSPCRTDNGELQRVRQRAEVLSSLAFQLAQAAGLQSVHQDEALIDCFRRELNSRDL